MIMKCRWHEQTGCQEGDQPWKKVCRRTHTIEKCRDRKGRTILPLYPYWRISATEGKKEGLGRKQPLQGQNMGLEDLTVA